MFEFLIIGAGITGVAVARLLQLKGENSFAVLEAEAEAGGLCRSTQINCHVLDIGGGHFLCSKFPEVYDFIFSHIPRDRFNYFERVSKIRMQNDIVDYPLESNLWELPIERQVNFLISAIQNGESAGKPAPANYEEWIRWKLGDRIAEEYMLPYNQKLWGVGVSEMDVDWLHKIPRLALEEIVRSCLGKSADKEKMPSHAGFYYPQKGGFQEIFNAIYGAVQKTVKLNSPATAIRFDKKEKCWVINEMYRAKRVVNTAPWNSLYQALGAPTHLHEQFMRLRGTTLVVSLWERPYNHDWHWCYCPDTNVEYHREFFIHNFAPHSSPNGMYTETHTNRWPGKNGEWSNGEKPVFEHVNSIAYPIPVIGHAGAIREILAEYEPLKLYGVGRWGQWQYLNADVCIREAMRFVEVALSGN